MDHNKQIVTDFYQQIFIKGNLSVLANYMHDNYIQHNPTVENGCKYPIVSTQIK